MMKLSEYERNMIGFLMGHGLPENDAEQTVIDLRMEQFGDANRQLTDENQRRPLDSASEAHLTRVPHDSEESRKIDAFRAGIGEDLWRMLGGDNADRRLLAMAISYNYKP